VTDKRKKRTLTKQEQKQVQAQYDLDNHLDSLFEAYVLTGDIFKLSAFVRDGGDIDRQNLRETIAKLILTGPPKHPHGSKDEQNIAFYIEAENRRLSFKPTKTTHKKGATPQEIFSSLIKTTKNDAIYDFEQVGGVDYLVEIAKVDPPTFCRLVSAIIPSEIKASVTATHTLDLKQAMLDGNRRLDAI